MRGGRGPSSAGAGGRVVGRTKPVWTTCTNRRSRERRPNRGISVCEEAEVGRRHTGHYTPLSATQLDDLFSGLESLTGANVTSRLSLAGTQGKVGLAHAPDIDSSEGWLQPIEGAASTHILKASARSRIEELELICMGAAEACNVRASQSDALMLGRPVISSERYDRITSVDGQGLHAARLHQEDLAQAFGAIPGPKYSEVAGGAYHALAQPLYERSPEALADVDQLAHVAVFDYLIGNCDNHLKNLSIIHSGKAIRLAPAYDLVRTTYFDLLAREMGMGRRRMRGICREECERVVPAALAAGERFSDVIDALPHTAEDLVSNMEPRLAVLS